VINIDRLIDWIAPYICFLLFYPLWETSMCVIWRCGLCYGYFGKRYTQTRAVDPDPKQFWMAGAGAKDFQTVEPEPEIWVPVPQIYFGGQASSTNNTMFFSDFLTKLFWSRSQKLLDVGAGAKNLRCPEPEPEIWAPAPQPWHKLHKWQINVFPRMAHDGIKLQPLLVTQIALP